MRIKINEEQKVYTPIKVELTLETIQEARLLFHVLNNAQILKVLQEYKSYDFGKYSKDIATEFTEGYYKIKQAITSQGFEV